MFVSVQREVARWKIRVTPAPFLGPFLHRTVFSIVLSFTGSSLHFSDTDFTGYSDHGTQANCATSSVL